MGKFISKPHLKNLEVILQRVLVVSSDRPLLAGIKELLKLETDLVLISTSTGDLDGIIREAREMLSDVIIMDDSLLHMDHMSIPDLLVAFSDLRVVVVSSSDNTLQVFEKKAAEIFGFQDLVSSVRGSG